MSFYGSKGQPLPAGGQRAGQSEVNSPQLFNFTQSQLQFQTGGHNLTFPDPNNQIQMQNIHQLTGGGPPQLLLQQQQPNPFPNLNVNFLTEQVGQILQPPSVNQNQSINLITPMSVALSGIYQTAGIQTQPSTTTQQPQQAKQQRVFTGTVTKTHDDFGFIDEEVFFGFCVVKGPILPKPGDRVLVEADFNPSMPFHWNATRVQIVNMGGGIGNINLNPGEEKFNVTHASQGNQSVLQAAQHTSSSASAATLLNINQSINQFAQSHQSNPKSNQQQQQQQQNQNAMAQSSGQQQAQPNQRYSSNSNPGMSMVSNPPYGGGRPNNNMTRPEDNSRVIAHSRAPMTRPPPPCITTPASSMVTLPSMVVDAHNIQHLQLPLPLPLPMSGVPLQIPSLNSLNRDVGGTGKDRERDARERERERERDARERERERDARERERGRDREKDRREKRALEEKKDRERERQPVRSRERSSSKRRKDDGIKRDTDKEKSGDSRSTRRSPIRDSRKRSRSKDSNKPRESLDQNSERTKSRSPSPKRMTVLGRPSPRYGWDLPKITLDETDVNVSELKRRYKNLYIPSDFFLARCSWQTSLPLHQPLDITHACPVHIFRRYPEKVDLEDFVCSSTGGNSNNIGDVNSSILLNPPDESDSLKVKVILLSMPNKGTMYRKACGLAEETTDISLQHLNRLINFIVGTKVSKNETMVIGGAWSPSLDGSNSESPQVLINTAIRTCKALTGLDLRRCTKWYRFLDLYYRRSSGSLETVVVLLPNLWAALPNRKEWEEIQKAYKDALLVDKEKTEGNSKVGSEENTPSHDNSSGTTPQQQQTNSGGNKDKANSGNPNINSLVKMEALLEAEIEDGELKEEMDASDKIADEFDIYGDLPPTPPPPLLTVKQEVEEEKPEEMIDQSKDAMEQNGGDGQVVHQHCDSKDNSESETAPPDISVEQDSTAGYNESLDRDTTTEECEEDNASQENKGTHFSLLDPKHMTVPKLKEELSRRGLNAKGLKPQLMTRLLKTLKAEESAEKLAQEKSNNDEKASEKVESMEIGESVQIDNTGADNELMDIPSDTKSENTSGQKENEQFNDETCTVQDASESSIQRANTNVVEEQEKTECPPSLMEGDGKTSDTVKIVSVPPVNQNKRSGLTVQIPVFTSTDFRDNEKTRKIWERRYALPKSPHLLLHPSKEPKKGVKDAKSSVFDCNQHSLNTLRDYRVADNKEQSFEVSLCAELFHEMLQRDFAFRIYRELVYQAKKISVSLKTEDTKTDDDAKDDKVVNGLGSKEESQTKKRKLSSSSSVTGATKSSVKTIDPHLLLAFVFFDHTRCGYITDVDFEDLCLSLNLGLTRAQVRKLVQKVVVKGVFHYRKWTDSTVDENMSFIDSYAERDDVSEESLKQLVQENKHILPVFGRSMELQEIENLHKESDDNLKRETESLLAAFADSTSVDVTKLRDQLEKSEKDRTALDSNMRLYKNLFTEAKVQIGEMKLSQDMVNEELNRVKEMLKKSEATEASNQADLQVFRQASQRFMDRVKDLIKSPAKLVKVKDEPLTNE